MSLPQRVLKAGRRLLFSPAGWLKKNVTTHSEKLLRLGTHYGGWTVADAPSLSDGVAVLCGAGEDISFDLALQSRYRNRMLIVDPTPRAISHYDGLLAAHAAGTSFPINNGDEMYAFQEVDFGKIGFVPLALWNAAGKLKFWTPKDEHHVSHSLTNLQGTSHYIEIGADTLSAILMANGYGADDISLLKLDIEGAETEIIVWLCDNRIFPPQLLIEFDEMSNPSLAAARKIKAAAKLLFASGYHLAHYDGLNNCLFIRML